MKKAPYLLLILIAAFAVRVVGINYGLPFLYHDDEPVVVNYAMAYGTGDLDPHTFYTAPLLSYILFFIYGLYFVMGYISGHFHSVRDFAYLYLNNPTSFYIIGRSLYGLICGTLSVLLVYLLGKKYFNRNTGLLAALFLAFNFLHVRDSHYIYYDIPLALCVILFFLKAFDLMSPARRTDYIRLGALLGMCLSVKYQGISLVFPFVAVVLYNFYVNKERPLGGKLADLAWCIGAMASVMFISNPYLFINIREFLATTKKFTYIPVSFLYHLKTSLFNGCGPLMTVFGVAGIALALFRRNKGVFLAAYTAFYYLLIVRVTQPGERLVLPILPILLAFAAFTVDSITGIIKDRRRRSWATVLLVAALMWPSLVRVYYSDVLFTREDTRTQAYRWIKDNIRPGTGIALDATASWFPRLEKDREQLKELKNYFGTTSFKKPEGAEDTKLRLMLDNPYYTAKTYRLVYLREFTKRGFLSLYPCINVSYYELDSAGVSYVVVSSLLMSDRYAGFIKELEGHAAPAKTFSPYKQDADRVGSLEISAVPAAAFMYEELVRRKSYGPYIRIYKMDR